MRQLDGRLQSVSTSATVSAGAVVLTVLVSGLGAQTPRLLLTALITAALLALATHPGGRLLLFVGTGMTVFQSSALGNWSRTAFVVLAVLGAVPIAVRLHREGALDRFREPVLLLAALLALCSVQAVLSNAGLIAAARDGTTYTLTMVAPIYGLDAGRRCSPRYLQALLTLVGLVGALAYLATWTGNRGQDLGFGSFALASSLLVMPSICMCLTLYYRSLRRPAMWAILALVQASILLLTGGRTLVVAVSVVFLYYLVLSAGPARWRKSVLLILLAVAAGYAALLASSSFLHSNFLTSRYGFFSHVSVTSTVNDPSGATRVRAYSIAHQAWLAHPILGQGLGYSYPSPEVGKGSEANYTLDTPLLLLSKFGLVGSAILVVVLLLLARALLAGSAAEGGLAGQVKPLVVGVLLVWMVLVPSGIVLEQKGYSLALALLVAVTTSWRLGSGEQAGHPMAGAGARRPRRKSTVHGELALPRGKGGRRSALS